MGVAVEVDGLAVEVADGVGVDGATLGVSDGVGETPGVAVAAAVALAVEVATLVGAAEASAVAVVVTAAVLDAAAIPGVAEATGDAMLGVADGVGVDGATLGVSDGVGETPSVAVAIAAAAAVTRLVGAAEAVGSGEEAMLGEGCGISGCSRFASGRGAAPCALASITGNASIQIENPISNARKAQVRVGPTITMPPSIARAPECIERRETATLEGCLSR